MVVTEMVGGIHPYWSDRADGLLQASLKVGEGDRRIETKAVNGCRTLRVGIVD